LDLNSNLISIFWNSHNQPQGNTNKATSGTTLSILTNANEFNNVPTVSVPQNNQGAGLTNVPELIKGIIQKTLVLPPLQIVHKQWTNVQLKKPIPMCHFVP
jgi:hypothetical protein